MTEHPSSTHDPHRLSQALAGAKTHHGPPDSWNPPFCGNIDIRIARDGTWYYLGSPIGRKELVRLFAGVLRREESRYVLVTPVEKVAITVDDAPFIATSLQYLDHEELPTLAFTTNVGDTVTLGADHPLDIQQDPETQTPRPYIHIRKDLWALIARPVFYELVDMAEAITDPESTDSENQVTRYVIESGGHIFELGHI